MQCPLQSNDAVAPQDRAAAGSATSAAHRERMLFIARNSLRALAVGGLLTTGSGLAQTVDAAVDNGVVKVGVSRAYGGAIAWLSTSAGGNLVNNADKGRQIQLSYYAGNSVTATNQCPAWSPWPWNPITAGDCANNPSPVLTLASGHGQVYVKTQPRLWDRNAHSLARAYMEQWISHHTVLSNVVVVDSAFTCFRDSNDEWGLAGPRDQELPACYFVACLNTIKSYTNTAPWTEGPLATIPNSPESGSFPWVRFTPTEQWSACVNSTNWGVGVYTPISTASLAGKHGTGTTCGTFNSSTMYVSPLGRYAFGRNSVFSYRYYLIVGSLAEIRSAVYALRASPPLPIGLTATAGSQQIHLTWNPVADAASYTVQRATTSGGPYASLATGLTSVHYTDTTLTNGTTYHYVVASVSGLGESLPSLPASATPACNFSLHVPSGDFESPYQGTGVTAYQYSPSGGVWTFSSAGLSGNASAFTSGNPAAPQGGQVAFLQQKGSFAQPLAGFVPGAIYTVTFAAAQRANLAQAGQTWDVTVNGIVIGSFAPPAGATTYVDYTASFTATHTTNTLAFVGTNLRGGDNTVFIDHVRITGLAPAPQITHPPVSHAVWTGAPATFSVSAMGSPLSYQWRRRGTNLAGATHSTHAIAAANADDAGDYDVLVSGPCGSTASPTATLTVHSPPVIHSPAWTEELFGFEVVTVTGLRHTVYASTNLVDWQPLLSTNPPVERFWFAEPLVPGFDQRFYRVLVEP